MKCSRFLPGPLHPGARPGNLFCEAVLPLLFRTHRARIRSRAFSATPATILSVFSRFRRQTIQYQSIYPISIEQISLSLSLPNAHLNHLHH